MKLLAYSQSLIALILMVAATAPAQDSDHPEVDRRTIQPGTYLNINDDIQLDKIGMGRRGPVYAWINRIEKGATCLIYADAVEAEKVFPNLKQGTKLIIAGRRSLKLDKEGQLEGTPLKLSLGCYGEEALTVLMSGTEIPVALISRVFSENSKVSVNPVAAPGYQRMRHSVPQPPARGMTGAS